MSNYYPYQSPPAYAESRNNGLALTSMITGLGGWLLYIISWCLSVAGAFLVVTYFCSLPLLGLSLISWIVAVIMGHVGIGQINASGGTEGGRGMAITGLATGYAGLGITCLLFAAGVVLTVALGGIGALSALLE